MYSFFFLFYFFYYSFFNRSVLLNFGITFIYHFLIFLFNIFFILVYKNTFGSFMSILSQ